MRVISVLNLKGGVAKTFTAANVAYTTMRGVYLQENQITH